MTGERATRDSMLIAPVASAYESDSVCGERMNYRWVLARHNPLQRRQGQVKHWYVALTDMMNARG